MTIWLLAILLTAIACAALYYAGARATVNAGTTILDATTAHFRAQLEAIENDAAVGRLGTAETTAAKGELARELLRLQGEAGEVTSAGSRAVVLVPIVLVAALALGTYAYLGRPDLPAEPLAQRTAEAVDGLSLDKAIQTIEARLKADPNDIRGWQVIAPVYMQMGRYADAVQALRKVNELAPPTPDSKADLAEALMMQSGGSVAGEPLQLFRDAVAMDPAHVRSLYYVASEETRTADYDAAARDWAALLKLGKGDEPWMTTARNGLDFANAELHPQASQAAPPNSAQIAAMVDGLDARLKSQGGSIDEWTQLVRSRMVEGRTADAQAAYDAARKAYPDPKIRTELDVLAADNGLVAQ
jgi:cytochrome c-type biogenesis protein CcmH